MNEQAQQIEVSIEEARKSIELGEALARLYDNPDFKKIISEGYFKDEPARLTQLLAHPAFGGEERQAQLANQLMSVSGFYQYLYVIEVQADQMRQSVEEDRAMLAEIDEETAGFDV